MGLINKFFGEKITYVQQDNSDLILAIEERERETLNSRNQNAQGGSISKGFSNKKLSTATPINFIGSIDLVQGVKFKQKGAGSRYRDINQTLSAYSKTSIANAVINLRTHQVGAYGLPSRYTQDGVGYEIVLKNNTKKSLPSETEQKEILAIEEFLHYTSTDRSTGINFRTWLKQTTRDILVYDQANTELVYERNSRTKLHSFYAVDAGSIYYIVNNTNTGYTEGKSEYKYVQKVDENHVIKFKEGELTFDVMNPRTDINSFKYGLSPLEVVLNQIGYHATTEQYNNLYFTQGGTTDGAFILDPGDNNGQQTRLSLDNLKREFSKFRGAKGAHTIPVIAAKDGKFVSMNQSSKDMEFEKWVNYLINIITSNFGVDPAEIGFPNRGGATGSKGNSLQESSKKETAQLSRDKGLTPLLDFIEDIINDNIVSRFGNGKYLFRFKGNELSLELQQLEKDKNLVESYLTVNEVRKSHNLDPVLGGDIVLSQFHINRLGQLQDIGVIKYGDKPDLSDDSDEQNVNNLDSENSNNSNATGKTDDAIMKDGRSRTKQSSEQK